MTTTPNTTLADQLAPLAGELANIQDKIATLQLEEASLKRKIRETVPGPDTYTAGGLVVIVSTNRRWDTKLASKVIPAELLALVSVTTTTVDKTKVSVLCPAQYDACFVTYDNVVKLR